MVDIEKEREGFVPPDYVLKSCPCCGSYDVGGVHDTVNCYKCGLKVSAKQPLQTAIDLWNTRQAEANQLEIQRLRDALRTLQKMQIVEQIEIIEEALAPTKETI